MIFISIGMVLGLALQFIHTRQGALFVLVMSLCFVTASLFLLISGDGSTADNQKRNAHDEQEDNLGLMLQRKKLAWQLLCFIPSFPLVYFLSLSRAISHDTTVVLFMACNVSTKIMFVAILMTSHVEILYVLFVTETHLNAAKRSFLRYIMHEVRVPLNSITMGIGLLEESDHLDEELSLIHI